MVLRIKKSTCSNIDQVYNVHVFGHTHGMAGWQVVHVIGANYLTNLNQSDIKGHKVQFILSKRVDMRVIRCNQEGVLCDCAV